MWSLKRVLRELWSGRRSFPTVAVSIVMALGIMIGGAFQQVRVLRNDVGPVATALLVLMLLILFAGYIRDALRGVFYERHIGQTIASFATGTWVAGTSVVIVTIVSELSGLRGFAYFLFYINVLILPAYLVIIVRNYARLWMACLRLKNKERIAAVHGVLLLACVATQSIVVAGSALYGTAFPKAIALGPLVLGSLFYFLGLFFILIRYLGQPTKNLADHWKNTNCIIHGAMSITGLASAKSHAVSPNVVVAIWLWVLVMFVLVEVLDILRGVQRVRRYGWRRGIFTYSIGQWARNFTFGMLLDFTMNLPLEERDLAGSELLRAIRSAILYGGKYVVITMFLIEVVLYLQKLQTERKEIHSTT